MKTIFSIAGIITLGIFVLIAAGFYPVAIVNSTPIFARTWQKAERAARNFEIAQARARGAKPIDFSMDDNRELLLEVKRGTLTFLIEDEIIIQKSKEVIEGLEVLARERVSEALRQSANPEQAARSVYGLSMDDFRNLVLMPQARIDALSEALTEKNQDLAAWLKNEKSKSDIRLFFNPFGWGGEKVK